MTMMPVPTPMHAHRRFQVRQIDLWQLPVEGGSTAFSDTRAAWAAVAEDDEPAGAFH